MPLLILLFDPGADHLQASQSFCPFKMLTGLPCPGCGMVKSMVSLYRGAWMESLEYHLFGPLMVLFSVCALVVMIIELIREKKYPSGGFTVPGWPGVLRPPWVRGTWPGSSFSSLRTVRLRF